MAASLAGNGGGDFGATQEEVDVGVGARHENGVGVTGLGSTPLSGTRADIFEVAGSLFSGRARPSSRAKLDLGFAPRQGWEPFSVSVRQCPDA